MRRISPLMTQVLWKSSGWTVDYNHCKDTFVNIKGKTHFPNLSILVASIAHSISILPSSWIISVPTFSFALFFLSHLFLLFICTWDTNYIFFIHFREKNRIYTWDLSWRLIEINLVLALFSIKIYDYAIIRTD